MSDCTVIQMEIQGVRVQIHVRLFRPPLTVPGTTPAGVHNPEESRCGVTVLGCEKAKPEL